MALESYIFYKGKVVTLWWKFIYYSVTVIFVLTTKQKQALQLSCRRFTRYRKSCPGQNWSKWRPFPNRCLRSCPSSLFIVLEQNRQIPHSSITLFFLLLPSSALYLRLVLWRQVETQKDNFSCHHRHLAVLCSAWRDGSLNCRLNKTLTSSPLYHLSAVVGFTARLTAKHLLRCLHGHRDIDYHCIQIKWKRNRHPRLIGR